MAWTTTLARNSVKSRLDIDSSVTTFDAQIDEFVQSGIKRLYPIVTRDVAAQSVTVSPDLYGEVSIDLSTLPTPLVAVRKAEFSEGYSLSEVNDTYHQDTNFYIRDLPTTTTKVRLYGLALYTTATIPEYLELPVVWYAMSEFYDFLAGNKRKYNVYMQGGARAVDNMREESDFYVTKANIYLNDRATLFGAA